MEPSFTEKPSLKSEKMLFPVALPLLVSNTEKWQQPRSRTPLDLNTPDTIFVTIFHKGSFCRTNVQLYKTWELGLACQGFYFCKVTGRVYFDQLTSCHLNIEYCMPLVEHPSWKHFWRFALGLISTALERVLQVHFILLPKRLLASHWRLQIEQWQYISLTTFNSSIARYSIQLLSFARWFNSKRCGGKKTVLNYIKCRWIWIENRKSTNIF